MQNALVHKLSPALTPRIDRVALLHQRATHRWTDYRVERLHLPPEEVRQDEYRAYRIRKHGKTELPLPPFLDPVVHEDELGYLKLKDQEWHVDTPTTGFRAELAANPYATMLASPLRQCAHTCCRLPRNLLQRFSIVKVPAGTKKLSIVPYSVAEDEPDSKLNGWTGYLINDPAVIRHVGKKPNWGRILDVKQTMKAARALSKNPSNFSAAKFVSWDTKMSDTIEAILSEAPNLELEKLARDHADLLLMEDQATARLDEVAVFVELTDGPYSNETLHNKPLYKLSCSGNADTSDAAPRGILYHKETIPLMTALERLRAWQKGKITETPDIEDTTEESDGND